MSTSGIICGNALGADHLAECIRPKELCGVRQFVCGTNGALLCRCSREKATKREIGAISIAGHQFFVEISVTNGVSTLTVVNIVGYKFCISNTILLTNLNRHCIKIYTNLSKI